MPDDVGIMKINKMTIEQLIRQGLVERYVRGELAGQDQQDFEEFLLDSRELQDEVYSALVLKQGLEKLGPAVTRPDIQDNKPGWWQRLLPGSRATASGPSWVAAGAFAAVSVLTLGLLFSSNQTINRLQGELGELQMPQSVSSVVLPMVRSGFGGDYEPMGTLQRTADGGWMVLNLELSFPEHGEYDVEILTLPQEQSALWINDLEPDHRDNLVFALHTSKVQAGDYLARVVYHDGEDREQLIATYAFSVMEGVEE